MGLIAKETPFGSDTWQPTRQAIKAHMILDTRTDEVSSFALVKAALVEPSGVALGLAGVGLSLTTVFVVPDATLPVQWTVAIGVMTSVYVTLCHKVIRTQASNLTLVKKELSEEQNRNSARTPKVLRAIKDPQNEEETVLLVEGNPLFGVSMLTSIYFEDPEGFEMLIANGVVQSAQSNGLLQILVSEWLSPYADLKDKVRAGADEPLKRLIIRPSATTNFVQRGDLELNQALGIILSRMNENRFGQIGNADDEANI